jgi:hypothetical protein
MMPEVVSRLLELVVVLFVTYRLVRLIWEFLQILAPSSPEIKAWVKTIKQAQKRAKAWWEKVTTR